MEIIMDLVKKIKLWRGIGLILNTKIGSSISHAIGQPVNWMASQAVSTNNDDIPWTPFNKPLAESCLAIVSTAGFYLEGDEPFDIDSARGEAGFRTIPSTFAKEKLKIAHTHYPHARVQEDINVLFPIERLLELVEAKVIGKLATNFYSFGFGGDLIQEFIGESDGSVPQLVQKLKADEVDCVLMIPA
jgi:D-proline reductase (dithiol) PrdB